MTRTQFCRRWIKLKPKQSRCLNNLGRDPWFSNISGNQTLNIFRKIQIVNLWDGFYKEHMTRTQFCRRWIKLKPKQSRCLNNLGRDPWFSKMMMESISGHQGCTIYVRFCDIFAPTPHCTAPGIAQQHIAVRQSWFFQEGYKNWKILLFWLDRCKKTRDFVFLEIMNYN